MKIFNFFVFFCDFFVFFRQNRPKSTKPPKTPKNRFLDPKIRKNPSFVPISPERNPTQHARMTVYLEDPPGGSRDPFFAKNRDFFTFFVKFYEIFIKIL